YERSIYTNAFLKGIDNPDCTLIQRVADLRRHEFVARYGDCLTEVCKQLKATAKREKVDSSRSSQSAKDIGLTSTPKSQKRHPAGRHISFGTLMSARMTSRQHSPSSWSRKPSGILPRRRGDHGIP